MSLALIQLTFHTRVESDISAFLSVGKNTHPGKPVLAERIVDSATAQIWLLAISGDTPELLAKTSKNLASQLRKSNAFSQVINGERRFSNQEKDIYFRYRYLIDPRVDSVFLSTAEIRRALKKRLSELASPMSTLVKEYLPSDPMASFLYIAKMLGSNADNILLYNGVWFSQDRKQVLLMLQTQAKSMQLDSQENIERLIDATFQEISTSAGLQLIKTGVPVLALESRDKIRTESQLLSVIASLFILLFLTWIYRSPIHVFLATLPLAGGVLFATAGVSLIFDNIHGITIAFGITLLGVAIDYPVHVFSHTHDGESIKSSIRRIWPTLRLGVLTTIVGYAVMAFAEIRGLAQLGIFSVIGLLSAALITRSLLPAVYTKTNSIAPRLTYLAGNLKIKAHKLWYVGLTTCFLLLVTHLLYAQPIWSNDIAELSPISTQARAKFIEFRQRAGIPDSNYILLVHGDTIETILSREEQLSEILQDSVNHQEIGRYRMLSMILPSKTKQLARQKALPDTTQLRQHLKTAAAGLPFKIRIFEPFIEDVERTRHLPPLDYKTLKSTPAAAYIDNLLFRYSNGFAGIVHLDNIKQPALLSSRLQTANISGVEFIDVKSNSNRLLNAFRSQTIRHIIWGLAVIIFILWLGVRNMKRLATILMPMLFAVIFAANIPLLLGDKLNLFHLVSLILVAGISLDYSLFFSGHHTNHRTLHALLICAVSTSVIFAMLAFSAIPVLHSIGIVVVFGVIAAFFSSWIFSMKISVQSA